MLVLDQGPGLIRVIDIHGAGDQIAVLADLHERDRGERRAGIREALSLMALAPEVAQLLNLLILQSGAKKIAASR